MEIAAVDAVGQRGKEKSRHQPRPGQQGACGENGLPQGLLFGEPRQRQREKCADKKYKADSPFQIHQGQEKARGQRQAPFPDHSGFSMRPLDQHPEGGQIIEST